MKNRARVTSINHPAKQPKNRLRPLIGNVWWGVCNTPLPLRIKTIDRQGRAQQHTPHKRARQGPDDPNQSPNNTTQKPPPSPFWERLVGRMQYAPTLTDKKRPERRVTRTRPEIRVSEAECSDASFSDFSVRSSSFSLGDRSLDLLLPPFLVSRQEKEVGAGGG